MTTFIYGLIDPRTDELRYIGKTNNIKQRLSKHLGEKQVNNHRVAWIKNLKNDNLIPDIFVIEEVKDSAWVEAERFWISYFKFIGANLVNHSDGGDGFSDCRLTSETRKIMSEAAKKRYDRPGERDKASKMHKGRVVTEEMRKNMSKALKGRVAPNKGKKMSESQRAFLSESRRGQKHTLKTRELLRITNSEINNRPEVIAKKINTTTENWKNPVVRERRMAGIKARWKKRKSKHE